MGAVNVAPQTKTADLVYVEQLPKAAVIPSVVPLVAIRKIYKQRSRCYVDSHGVDGELGLELAFRHCWALLIPTLWHEL
jgi:hypothetical protein